MGSRVKPYFILTAEKIDNPLEQKLLPRDVHEVVAAANKDKTPPMTPAPSSNTEDASVSKTFKLKKTVNFKGSTPRADQTKKRMGIIKEKLEKSRERYQERKRMQDEAALKCEPTVISLDPNGYFPYNIQRTASDLGPSHLVRERAQGTFPYVYFVVAGDRNPGTGVGLTVSSKDETITVTKSADKRRKEYLVRRHNRNKAKREENSKLQHLARELGLKSNPITPLTNKGETTLKSNQIEFPLHWPLPPRNPPTTPATVHSASGLGDPLGKIEMDQMTEYTDDRKHSYTGPQYHSGRPINHNYSMQKFELPFVTPEQQRKALGLTKSDKLPQTPRRVAREYSQESIQKKVHFAEALPVIRGNGFVVPDLDFAQELGPKSISNPEIELNAMKPSESDVCRKIQDMQQMGQIPRPKKIGVPLSLPKIDIVTSAYDEMVLKMLKEYLQDSNTPSRQQKIAKDLLAQLEAKQDKEREREDLADYMQTEGQFEKLSDAKTFLSNGTVRPETKGEPRSHRPETKESRISRLETKGEGRISRPETKGESRGGTRPNTKGSTKFDLLDPVSVVKITYKNRGEISNVLENSLPKTTREYTSTEVTTKNTRQTREKPVYNPVPQVFFKMAPPGISKESTDLSAVSARA